MKSESETAAVPVGIYQVVVVHLDGLIRRFGMFRDVEEAKEWAMSQRPSLGLTTCASWRVEAIGATDGRDLDAALVKHLETILEPYGVPVIGAHYIKGVTDE